ncbi:MAG TPA: T9SS type A sorting domain-containing protein [Bacteroidia bacterium]|nr:T9SS type A sorting domain-containing protein [Bacteroidia bacterium]
MRIFTFYFSLLLFILFKVSGLQATTYYAGPCPATYSGFTAAKSPWWTGLNGTGTQLTAEPSAGDVLIIPAGCTLSISNGITISNVISISVFGQLLFPGPSDALNLPSGSIINVASGGSISGPSSSNQIKIGHGGADWSGPGTSNGPFSVSAGGLPIELIDFTGTCLTNGVELNWSTASEENNDYFLVEKSSNGTDWDHVAKISGSGTSGVVNKYVHIDYSINHELMYYRLTQVDKNSAREVFKAIDVNCKNVKDQIVLYPNPSSSEVNILLDVTTSSNNNYIRILNSFGQVVLETKVDVIKGVNTFVLPLEITSGTYNVMFSSDNIVLPSQKLLITK